MKKIAYIIILISLPITAIFAEPNGSASKVDVSLYVGKESNDTQMSVVVNAVGDTDCSKPTSGEGVCENMIWENLKQGSQQIVTEDLLDITPPAFKMTSASLDPKYPFATGTLTMSFQVVLGSNQFTATQPLSVNNGILSTDVYPVLSGVPNNVLCDLKVVAATSQSTDSLVTFSCID